MRKGVLLAGGTDTGLLPVTTTINKHLLKVADIEVLLYPLSFLADIGVEEVLIISTLQHIGSIQSVIDNSSFSYLNVKYSVQSEPNGIVGAFLLAEEFLQGEPSILILGDNLFCDHEALITRLREVPDNWIGGLTCEVNDPSSFGVVKIKQDKVISIEEKPLYWGGNTILTGMYFFDGRAIELAKNVRPSYRNELEIVDLIQQYIYLEQFEAINVMELARWYDVGTWDNLHAANEYISTIYKEKGD